MLNILIKTFDELNTVELYKLLQLRSEVFVVEQDCVYQDIDDKDFNAIHILGYNKKELVAYTRIFKQGDYFKEASIGRVVVKENKRANGYGYDIMNTSLSVIKNKLHTRKIRISAQTYLTEFYNNLGFVEIGEEYLEDGIPHVNMLFN